MRMRWVVISVLIVCGMVYSVLNTSFAVQQLLPRVVYAYDPSCIIQFVSLQQYYQFLDTLTFTNIKIHGVKATMPFRVEGAFLQVQQLRQFLGRAGSVICVMKNVGVGCRQLYMGGLTGTGFYHQRGREQTVRGKGRIDVLSSSLGILRNIEYSFSGDGKKSECSLIESVLYDGMVRGTGAYKWEEPFQFSLAVSGSGLATEAMKDDYVFFENIKGLCAFEAYSTGKNGQSEHASVRCWLEPGGMIKASLIRTLVPYIPGPQQKKILQFIEKSQYVPVEKAEVSLIQKSNTVVVGRLDLQSKQLNLDIHVSMDINLEAGLTSVLKYLEKIKKERSL